MWIRWLLTPYCSRKKFLIILYRSEICTILACFCLFGCHSNSLFSLKNSDDIFEFYNPETPITYVEIGTVLRTELKSVHFLLFCVNLVAMATPFAPLKFFISIFEFSDIENPTIHANIVSIAFTELNSAEFWFILT